MADKPELAAGRKSWKKGQSGNPGGRPKMKLLTDALREELLKTGPLDELFPDEKTANEQTRARRVAINLLHLAIGEKWQNRSTSRLQAIALIFDRIEGKVETDLGSDPENPYLLTMQAMLNAIKALPKATEINGGNGAYVEGARFSWAGGGSGGASTDDSGL